MTLTLIKHTLFSKFDFQTEKESQKLPYYTKSNSQVIMHPIHAN